MAKPRLSGFDNVAKRNAAAVRRKQTDGLFVMFYVYILQSIHKSDSFYIGFTVDLKQRLKEHNSGKSVYTNKFKPWKIKNYFAFDDEQKARDFELYLKTHSGRKFCKNHL